MKIKDLQQIYITTRNSGEGKKPAGFICDEQLVREVLDGDISSFGSIVERHWNMAVALAISKNNNATEAEDISQESFIKAYANLHKLRNPERFAGWLAKIVNQQCTDHIRKAGKRKIEVRFKREMSNSLDSRFALSHNPGLSESQIRFVRAAVASLPEKFRKIVIMRFVSGLSCYEIAEQLGKRSGTIRVWLHRSYKILKSRLTPAFKEAE